MKLCVISPFPPQSDGIAEFNDDMLTELTKYSDFSFEGINIKRDGLPVHTDLHPIIFSIDRDTFSDYTAAAAHINMSDVDLVCIQLEYAVYGGFDGEYIASLIKQVKKKVVLIIHGLPINSYSRRKLIRKKFFKELQPYVAGYIVINPIQERVLNSWGIIKNVITIPHGIPSKIVASTRIVNVKQTQIFTFGLLHKKKGLEYLLAGFNSFSKSNNRAHLTIVGGALRGKENEKYLSSLLTYSKNHSLENKVTIIPQFLPRETIYKYLLSSDIVVFPYIKRDLVSSGALSFAIGARTFVVTTPFPYAKEILDKTEAYFVPYENSNAISNAFNFFTNNPSLVNEMQDALSKKAGKLSWEHIAKKYYEFFTKIISQK
ncbi:glycosyltransferase family 4 protein [soil metagenome]